MLALTIPDPMIAIPAIGGLLLVLALFGGDLRKLSYVMIVGGWGVFALTSPSAEFPTALRPLGIFAFTGGAAVHAALHRRPKLDRPRRIAVSSRCLFAYCVFVLLGCMASPNGPKNLFRGVQGVMIIGTAFYAVTVALGEYLLLATFLACTANVMLTMVSRQQELDVGGNPTGRLAGYMQPNHLAYTAAEVLMGVMWLLPQDRHLTLPFLGRTSIKWPLRLIALVSLYVLFASRSRTGWIAIIFALVIAAFSSIPNKERRTKVVVWTVSSILVLAPIAGPSVLEYLNRDNSESSITSLTGRTNFWPLAVDLIKERPIIGWGVNVILSPAGKKFQDVLPGVGQAHNSYLEAGLQSGVIGMVAWALSLIAMMVGSFRIKRTDPYRMLLIAGTILTFGFALTESSPAWFGDMFIVYVLCAAIYSDRIQPRDDADEIDLASAVRPRRDRYDRLSRGATT